MNKVGFNFPVGPVAIVCAAFLWSLDGLLRRSLYTVPSLTVVFLEHLFGALLLCLFVSRSWQYFKQFTRKQWGALVMVSLFSGVFGTYCYTAGLARVQYIPFSVVVLLQQLQPVFAILTAAIFLKERLTKKFIALAVLALVSAYAVSFPDLRVSVGAQSSDTLIAAGFAILAALCWGSSTALSKYALSGTSWLHTTTVRFVCTSIFAGILMMVLGQYVVIPMLEPIQWQTLVAITLSTGMVALGLYYLGLQLVPASRCTILELTWPVSAVLIGYIFLDQQLSTTQWVGSIVLIGTMYAVVRETRATQV